MRGAVLGLGAVAVVALIALYNSLFIVHQSQQALVLQFGNPVRVREPGLHMMVPFIQQVEFFERRVLDFDAPSVDGAGRPEAARGRRVRALPDRRRAALPADGRRGVVPDGARADHLLGAALGPGRGLPVRRAVRGSGRADEADPRGGEPRLERFGVEVVDVRIKRADLPAENSQAIFRRMQTEREQAAALRAQGRDRQPDQGARRPRAPRDPGRGERQRRCCAARATRTASASSPTRSAASRLLQLLPLDAGLQERAHRRHDQPRPARQ